MRRFVFAAVAVVSLLAGCTSSATSQDPYQLAQKAIQSPRQQVQVDIGASVKSAGTTVTLDPGTIRLVIDSTAGKGSFHLSLPKAVLGDGAASLAQLGITGSTIDLDAVYDGDAFYAKSPLLGALVGMLMSSSGGTPSGDLTGWLRLASKSDLESLASGAVESAAPSPSMDAATIRKDLNDSGITLTFAGTEKRNGADADHITAAVDIQKLIDSPVFDSAQRDQIDQLRAAAKNATLSADLWTDHASGQLSEFDIHVAATGDTAGTADVTVTLGPPAAGASIDTPANAVDVPAMTLIGQAFQMFGQSLGQ